MQSITLEYFEDQLDSLYADLEDIKNSLLKQYMFSKDEDIYITQHSSLDTDDEVECLTKLHTQRDNIDIYMYLVKADRSRLPSKQELLTDKKLTELEKEVMSIKKKLVGLI